MNSLGLGRDKGLSPNLIICFRVQVVLLHFMLGFGKRDTAAPLVHACFFDLSSSSMLSPEFSRLRLSSPFSRATDASFFPVRCSAIQWRWCSRSFQCIRFFMIFVACYSFMSISILTSFYMISVEILERKKRNKVTFVEDGGKALWRLVGGGGNTMRLWAWRSWYSVLFISFVASMYAFSSSFCYCMLRLWPMMNMFEAFVFGHVTVLTLVWG